MSQLTDYEASVTRYDHREFPYAPDGPPETPSGRSDDQVPANDPPELTGDFYGQAIVPRSYFRSQWCDASNFELLDFVADRSVCEQAVAILRRTT
jgi:hypothetical protein